MGSKSQVIQYIENLEDFAEKTVRTNLKMQQSYRVQNAHCILTISYLKRRLQNQSVINS